MIVGLDTPPVAEWPEFEWVNHSRNKKSVPTVIRNAHKVCSSSPRGREYIAREHPAPSLRRSAYQRPEVWRQRIANAFHLTSIRLPHLITRKALVRTNYFFFLPAPELASCLPMPMPSEESTLAAGLSIFGFRTSLLLRL